MLLFLSSISWILSIFITSFTVIPLIIVLRFGIPITYKLDKSLGVDNSKTIIKKYKLSIILLSTIYLLVALLTYFLSQTAFRGFLGGSVIALLLGIGKTGQNNQNIKDYAETNYLYYKLDPQHIELIIKSFAN
jgi:hypothetical protein